MTIGFLILAIAVLLIMGGLLFNMSLYKRGVLHRMQKVNDRLHNEQLHNMIFLHN